MSNGRRELLTCEIQRGSSRLRPAVDPHCVLMTSGNGSGVTVAAGALSAYFSLKSAVTDEPSSVVAVTA
jgi:hypothetical protein